MPLIFSQLPVEFHLSIQQWLSSIETVQVGKTNSHLRSIYTPLGYANCLIFPKSLVKSFNFDSQYIIIPLDIFLRPEHYSWFPNYRVQKLLILENTLSQFLADINSFYGGNHLNINQKYPNLIATFLHRIPANRLNDRLFNDADWKKVFSIISIAQYLNCHITCNSELMILPQVGLSHIKNLKICWGVEHKFDFFIYVSKMVNLEYLSLFPGKELDATKYKLIFKELAKLPNLKKLETLHFYENNTLETVSELSDTLDYHKVIVIEPLQVAGWSTFRDDSINIQFKKLLSVTHIHSESQSFFKYLNPSVFPRVNTVTLKHTDAIMNISHLISSQSVCVDNIVSLTLSFLNFGGALKTLEFLPKFQKLKYFNIHPWSENFRNLILTKVLKCPMYQLMVYVVQTIMHVAGDHFISTICLIDQSAGTDIYYSGNDNGECARFTEILETIGYIKIARECGISAEQTKEIVHSVISYPMVCLLESGYELEKQSLGQGMPTVEETLKCVMVKHAYIEALFKVILKIPALEYLDISKIPEALISPRLRCLVEIHPSLKRILVNPVDKGSPYSQYTKPLTIFGEEESFGIDVSLKNCWVIDVESKNKHFHPFESETQSFQNSNLWPNFEKNELF